MYHYPCRRRQRAYFAVCFHSTELEPVKLPSHELARPCDLHVVDHAATYMSGTAKAQKKNGVLQDSLLFSYRRGCGMEGKGGEVAHSRVIVAQKVSVSNMQGRLFRCEAVRNSAWLTCPAIDGARPHRLRPPHLKHCQVPYRRRVGPLWSS